jgi:hypothetical protein
VNRAESDQIVVTLRDRGFPVEYLLVPDEGHSFARPVNKLAIVANTEKFLARYLGGRFQESVPSEVATRLKEITVDPKTVVDPSSIPLYDKTTFYLSSPDIGNQHRYFFAP